MEGFVGKKIGKDYRSPKGEKLCVLQDISFHWKPGEFISLVGESGSGKSTLARLISGFEKPSSGSLLFEGEDTGLWTKKDWRVRRAEIQAVFQDVGGSMNPALSVRQNLEMALRYLTNLNRKERHNRISELMELTNMDAGLLKVPVRRLSGGEQRRLALLRCMAIRPKYMILDEILSGLDLISAHAVMNVLESYRDAYSCAFFLITHNVNSAYRLSHKILTIQSGKITRVSIKK